MIRAIVDFALNNRFLIVLATLLLLIWGAISFERLPVEAYPDVANNYVQVITQWPGRAAEEVEQQVTIPIEIVMNGIPHLDHLRSVSIFGLSSLSWYSMISRRMTGTVRRSWSGSRRSTCRPACSRRSGPITARSGRFTSIH